MDEIRHADEILYSPAPDIYHDIVGHLPMLQDPRFSEYYAVFGRAGTRTARGAGRSAEPDLLVHDGVRRSRGATT